MLYNLQLFVRFWLNRNLGSGSTLACKIWLRPDRQCEITTKSCNNAKFWRFDTYLYNRLNNEWYYWNYGKLSKQMVQNNFMLKCTQETLRAHLELKLLHLGTNKKLRRILFISTVHFVLKQMPFHQIRKKTYCIYFYRVFKVGGFIRIFSITLTCIYLRKDKQNFTSNTSLGLIYHKRFFFQYIGKLA